MPHAIYDDKDVQIGWTPDSDPYTNVIDRRLCLREISAHPRQLNHQFFERLPQIPKAHRDQGEPSSFLFGRHPSPGIPI